jgi:hypothetical protein
MEWTIGLQNYKKCSLELGEKYNYFTTELLDVDFERNRDITDIFYDHLATRQTKYVEVLYSGGMDSELVLLACLQKNIPVKAITLAIKIDGMIINTHDLYYAEKFCRENNVEQTILDLDAVNFFESGKYYDYLSPYYITEPHVATHFWLLTQCSHFPVLGGDWPWVQMHFENKVISPARLEFSSYEKFMTDNSIHGIGNMIGYSLESSVKIMQIHLSNYIPGENVSSFKSRMYRTMYPKLIPRLRSYGWESKLINFNLFEYKINLLNNLKLAIPKIKWGKTIAELLGTSLTENSKFA